MNSRQFKKYANYVLNGIVEDLEVNINSAPTREEFEDAIEIITNLTIDASTISDDDGNRTTFELCKDELTEIKSLYQGLNESVERIKLAIKEADDDDEIEELEFKAEQAINDTCTMICDILFDLVQAIDTLGSNLAAQATAKFNALAQTKQSLQPGEKGEVSAG